MRQLLVSLGIAIAAQPAIAQRGPVAVVGATVIDGTGRAPLADATIVMDAGVITAIGPSRSTRIPDGAERIDGRGKYVVPGFVDVNVHLTQYNFAVAGLDAWSDSAAISGAVRGARELLRHGVTTARDSYGILPLLLSARESMRRDTLAEPKILVAGNVIGWDDVWSYTFSGSTGGRPRDSLTRRLSAALVQGVGEKVIDLTADSLRQVIGRYLDAGPDFLKIGVTGHTDDPAVVLFSPRSLAAMIEAAHSRGKKVDVHAGNYEALRAAALAGVDILQHPEVLVHRLTRGEAGEIARTGTICALMPRNTTAERWAEFRAHVEAGGRFWPAEMPLQRLRARNDSLRRLGVTPNAAPTRGVIAQETMRANSEQLIRAGCRIAVATDDIAGPNKEMGLATVAAIEGLVELGMSPMQALIAATANGGAAAGSRTGGTLTKGMAADLLLLTRNPLEDIRNVRGLELVIVGGRVVR